MRMSLRANKKHDFIDGTVKQPDNDSLDLEDWWTIDQFNVGFILS